MSLDAYNQKRNFDKTAEPPGKPAKPAAKLRYVIQHHLASREHYDLRLEMDGALKSWAVPKGLSQNPTDKRLAVQVEDHPLSYRNFEGTIPKGQYGGGTVTIWDKGTYELHERRDDVIKFTLHGQRLNGKWTLRRTKDQNWLLIAGAQQNPAISHMDLQLCKLTKTIPSEDGWLFELKYDGWRVLSFAEGGQARLLTRNGNNCTAKFKPIAQELMKLGRSCVIDGEMMKHNTPLQYIAFDLLALDGEDLRGMPLLTRKQKLEQLLRGAPDIVQYSTHMEGNGAALFEQACAANLEGIVAKRADSLYTGKREWLKIKCENYARGEKEDAIEGVTISSPEKIFSHEPRVTKRDLALYYQQVAPRMLPHIEQRKISAIRCPGGAGTPTFFKKKPPVVVNSAQGLIEQVQQNTVEFHIGANREGQPPDVMVFDLDPDEGLDLTAVRQGARDLKRILDKLGWQSYLKTSGGKGYHVVVPVDSFEDWERFRDVAKNIVDMMVAQWPERYTNNVRKVNRKGKIFVDWLRNTRGATSVAPYSVRMRLGLPVSCPISWSELGKVAPDGIDMAGALQRLKRKDPWI